MKVRLSIEYEVEDENPDVEKLGVEVIRGQADASQRRSRKRSPTPEHK